MKTITYPLTSDSIPKNINNYRRVTFLKQVKITEGDDKRGVPRFRHLGQDFQLGGDFLDKLIGFEVLVDAAFNVTMDGLNLGKARAV